MRVQPAQAVGDAPSIGPETALEALVQRMKTGDRTAVAEYLDQFGPYLRRRARGRMGSGLRRMVDSLDMVATVGRRLDQYVANRRLQASTPPQFNALINRVMHAALVDKVRALGRLRHAEPAS